MTTLTANSYFGLGCGRCKHFSTPACKVHTWVQELDFLRNMLLTTELKEEIKWSVPCYTSKGKNVLILAAFRDYCSLNFFRGDELTDPAGLLVKAGGNSQAGRQLRFRSMEEINASLPEIIRIIRQAIQLEMEGKPVPVRKAPDIPLPQELLEAFEENPELKVAFERLSPGRKRSHLMHFQEAKQSDTRRRRIAKNTSTILEGKGFNER